MSPHLDSGAKGSGSHPILVHIANGRRGQFRRLPELPSPQEEVSAGSSAFWSRAAQIFDLCGRPDESETGLVVLDLAQVRGTFCNDDLQGGPDMAFAEVAGLSAAVPGAQHNVDMNAATVVLSALVAGSVLIGNRIFPRIPLSLVAVVGTITPSPPFHFAEKGIPVIGPVPGGLPSLGLPDVTCSEAPVLVPVALSCFAMIIAQSAATSGAFALRYHENVDEDADILGLSVANAVAAISGAFVVDGSPTQTAMADRGGARSQIAQLAFAGVALVVLLFLPVPFNTYPAVCWRNRVHDRSRDDRREGSAQYSPRKPRGVLSRAGYRRGSCCDRRRTRHFAGDCPFHL